MHVHHAMALYWHTPQKGTRYGVYCCRCGRVAVCGFCNATMGQLRRILDRIHYWVMYPCRCSNNYRRASGCKNMEQIKKLLRPPCENEVRVIVAIMTLWVGVPRLIPGAQFGGLRFADPVVYGILMTIIGVALLVTCYNGYSRTVWGKLIAGIAFVSWTMLAALQPQASPPLGSISQ